MAFWDADPVVEDQPKAGADWWKNDPLAEAEPTGSAPAAKPTLADLMSGRYGTDVHIPKDVPVPTVASEIASQATKLPAKAALIASGAGALNWPTDKELETPLFTPEQMKTVMPYAYIADAHKRVYPDSPVAQAAAGITGGLTDVASSASSPENLAMLGVAPEGNVAQRLVAGTFLGQAIAGTPEQWKAFKEAPELTDKIRIATAMGLGYGLPILGMKGHAKAGEVPKVDRSQAESVMPETAPEPQAPASSVPVAPSDNPAMARFSSEVAASDALPQKPVEVLRPQPEISIPVDERQAPSVQAGTEEQGQAQGKQDYFIPSTEWQEVPDGTVLPNGGEYRFDQRTGKNFARWKPENLPRTESGQVVDNPVQESTYRQSQPATVSAEGENKIPSQPERSPASQPETTPTSTKNAINSVERENRGITPAIETAKREFGTVWDEAERTAAADPTAPERLVSEIAANPRALTDHENALLLRRQIEVQNEHDAAIKAVNDAPGDPSAERRLSDARDALQTVYDAAKSAGTETGRGLNARKMLANNDYSLAKMEAETRAVVNNGKALTERQAADVKALHDRIRAAEEKLSAYEAREQFEIELKKAKAEARKTGFKPQSFLEQQAARARERIIARRGKLFADPIGITQVAHLADEAIIGASHIARGVTKFADWSAQMIADFGDRIKPHLQALFAKAREIHASTAKQAIAPLTGRSDMLSRTAAGESPFERQLGGDKKRIRANIEEIQEKTATGDFAKPEKKPPRMDVQKAALLFEFQKAKEAYNKKLFEAQLAKQSAPRKVLRYGGEMLNTTRALMTSFDLSAVLRQGGFIGFGHPIRALRAFPDMIRALRSEQAQFRVMEDIKNRPNAPLYQQAKLYISDQGPGVSLSKMEEQYMSRWARHIPGVGASERAYTTFLNRLRADSFDTMAENLGKRGKVTLDEAKAIANYVNVATGRGNLDAAAKAATGLNTFFFAPRYVVSRFQLLAGQPLMRGTGRTRALIAKEYAKTLAGAAVVYSLGQAAGATVNTDPTSPDFLKLKFGNTRVDPLFGLTQSSVFLTREALALKRFVTQDQSKPPKYGSGGEVLGRFLRSKLAPAIGSAVDALSGKNVVGQKVTPGTMAGQLAVPLSIGDVYNAMKDQGMPRGAILGILAIFGMGVQNYQTKPAPQSTPRSLRQAMEERKLESMARYLQAA